MAQIFLKTDVFALLSTPPEMASKQSQHGLRSQNANRMLTLFRKICFDGKNSQSLVPTVKTPETPVKSRVSGVLKGAEERSKCSKRHPLPRTRNQFAGNRTWVRIPPSPPELAVTSHCQLFYIACSVRSLAPRVDIPSLYLQEPAARCDPSVRRCLLLWNRYYVPAIFGSVSL